MKPITRQEQFYDAILTGKTSDLPKPITREEEYLNAIANKPGGGGGGVSTYAELPDKPKINGVTLEDNTSLDALGVQKTLKAGDNIEIEADGTINAIGGTSDLSADLTASVDVGGVSAGDTFNEGASLESVVRSILSPTLYPTLTNPSASMTATGAKLIEKGGSLAVTFTISFNRGSISPAYGTSGHRSGAATEYTLDGTSQAGNTFAKTITEGKTSYKGSVAYAAGEQPKDSNGGNYDSPLPAGSVETNTIAYEFVNALWANTANISTVAKLALVSKTAKVKQFDFPAATIVNPEIFDVPADWTVTGVEVLNTMSGQWEDCSGEFDISNVNHDDAGGTSTAYKRYTNNLGYAMGARKVRVKWS